MRPATKINVSWRYGWTGSEWEAEMRGMFTILGLLLVVAIVGVLVKKQMGSIAGPATVPAIAGAPAISPGATPQQTVQQFKQAVQTQMQQPPAMPDDAK
jgi:peptidoglycan/LPS O-acetylase OafA/YrhL